MTLRARRFVTALLLSAAMAAGTTLPSVASAQVYASPNQPNYASIVVDASTGEVLYGKRADSPRYPASITKVMTLYLTFEAMAAGKLKPDDLIVVSPRAAAQPPSKLGLRPGSTIRVDDAISALAVNSANDIAVALAERLGGTEQRFAALMTLRAQELGMRSTRFVNAHGLPDSRQLSSARDIAVLSRAVMRDFPQYYGRFGQRSFRGHNNHNRLLHRMPGVDGLKTGFTNASGYNLAASAVRDGRRLIAVVLGGTTGASRDAHTADLLNAGFTVMASRARGERMELASMFPERTTMLASVAPAVEQGDRTPEKPTAAEAKELALALPETKLVSKLRGREALEEKAPKSKAEKAKAEKLKADDAKLEKASDKKKAGKGDKAKAADEDEAPKGTWYVQVGAFPSKDGAQDQLKTVLKKYATHFSKADGKVEKAGGNGHWRARYYGFSPDEAKAACKALDKKNVPCLAVKS
jgi:D-alanyl-D-alanine carboxypeptidase (penicillin-binding protein 5/6)